MKNGVVYAFNHNPFQIAVAWSGVVPANLDQKKLFDIHLSFKGEATSVTFKPDCEVTDVNLNVISLTFYSGSVASGLPQIILQPNDTVVKPWGRADFQTTAENATTFQWKESNDDGQTWYELTNNDIYKGTLTNHLVVQQVPPSYNKFRYSCMLNSAGCPVSTQDAILRVDSLTSVPGVIKNDFSFQVMPNPVTDITLVNYVLSEEGLVSLDIINVCGSIIARPFAEVQGGGFHSVRFSASELAPGIYFCRLNFKGKNSANYSCRKILKLKS